MNTRIQNRQTIVLMLVSIGILLCTLPASSSAEEARGMVSVWSGTSKDDVPQTFGGTCASAGCQGDLVTCGPTEALFVAKVTFSFLEDVCDDDSATPCAGRATGISEGCFDLTPPPAGKDINLNGNVLSVNARGKERYCFDESAQSDCSGSPPSAAVMAEATTVLQFRQFPPQTGPSQASAEHTLGTLQEFTLDGKSTRLKVGKVLISQFTAEPNAGDNCGGGGCGLAGNSVRVK
jgi:hypothetical protein